MKESVVTHIIPPSAEIDLTAHFALEGDSPFCDRHATMPWRGSVPIAKEEQQSTWQALLESKTPACKRLLYIHIPFCATHCTFCGFYQNNYHEEACSRYTDALLREISAESDSLLYQSAPIHAVYFGGGTPSALSAKDLYRVITHLRQSLPLAPDCEITLEGRVLNFDDNRIDACLDAGANRFSIGIQTFNSKIRKRMARTSTGEEAAKFMKGLCLRDRAAVVCDLLFGLPGQDATNWQEDLTIAHDIGLDGVDLYALNLLPNTPLGKAVENQRITVPSPIQRRDLYLQGCDFMENVGWRQISNSHWARTTRERNLYNLLIKQGADCLAFGSGAGGTVNGYSWMIERSLDNYYQKITDSQKPLMMMSRATDSGFRWRHELQAGIECGRVDLAKLSPQATLLSPLLNQWYQAGLVEDDFLCMKLTNEGRFWASNLLTSLQQLILQLNTPR